MIEIMIAISVFAIGILVVLQLVIRNMSVVDQVKVKTSATILAKEWIELAFNIRDANLSKWLPRDCVIDPDLFDTKQEDLKEWQEFCITYFSENIGEQVFQIWFDTDNYYFLQAIDRQDNFLANFYENMLFLRTWDIWWYDMSRYSHSSNLKHGEDTTPYARYISFSTVQDSKESLPEDIILKVESHVLTLRAGNTWDIVLESLIWNY